MKYFKGFASEVAIKPIESIVKKKMEGILIGVEKELFTGLNSIEEKFLALKQSKFKLGKINNFAFLSLFNNVFPLLFEHSLIAYKMGLKDQYKIFNYNQPPNISQEMETSIKHDCLAFVDQMSKTYEYLIERQLLASLRAGDDYPTFVGKLREYKDFSKSLEGGSYSNQNSEKFPTTPNKNTFIQEVGAFLHKQFTKAKVFIMENVGGVEFAIYHTQEDEKVSTICRKWDGVRLPINKIAGIIPQHANCRCYWEGG